MKVVQESEIRNGGKYQATVTWESKKDGELHWRLMKLTDGQSLDVVEIYETEPPKPKWRTGDVVLHVWALGGGTWSRDEYGSWKMSTVYDRDGCSLRDDDISHLLESKEYIAVIQNGKVVANG